MFQFKLNDDNLNHSNIQIYAKNHSVFNANSILDIPISNVVKSTIKNGESLIYNNSSNQWISGNSGGIGLLTTGFVPKASNGYLINSVIEEDSGYIGIGKNPNYNLDVAGITNTNIAYYVNGVNCLTDKQLFPLQNKISVGLNSGIILQGINCISIGINTGTTNQGTESIAIGYNAGNTSQGIDSIAIGTNSAATLQGINCISIGLNAGYTTQGNSSVSIGDNAGYGSQGNSSIAIGNNAGYGSQGGGSISMGYFAGQTSQGINAVCIGFNSAYTHQGDNCVSIGVDSGAINQGINSISIGNSSGNDSQGTESIAIGYNAGNTSQGIDSIAIGTNSAATLQGINCISIGLNAGYTTQGNSSVSIGDNAGYGSQGNSAVAIGNNAGGGLQGNSSVSIGDNAGYTTQGNNSIAIGNNAGNSLQGNFSIAIGNRAGLINQNDNTIIINAVDGTLNSSRTDACYISPIHIADSGNTHNILLYDSVLNEIVVSSDISPTNKTFIIDHPLEKEKYLIHACLEGPESGVYYRGKGEIIDENEYVEIKLPEYTSVFCNFTVQLTLIREEFKKEQILSCSEVENRKFKVYGKCCKFFWLVHAMRESIISEPLRSDINIHGNNTPYKFYTQKSHLEKHISAKSETSLSEE